MNEEDRKRARDFVSHLFRNPNIKDEPPLIAEGLLLNFIVQNTEQLKLTFKTPQFFPHLSWNEVLQIIISDLYERISAEVLPLLTEFFENINYDVLNKLNAGSPLPRNFQKEKSIAFLRMIFKNRDVRYNLNSAVTMLNYEIIDKYVNEIFEQRGFLYNEIVRVQRTNLEVDEYIVFLKILMILRSAAFMKIDCQTIGTVKKIGLNEALKMRGKFSGFLNEMTGYIRSNLPNLSDKTIRLAIKSNLQDKMTEVEEASSRLLYILCTRYHNYKPVSRVDRGAESPDKSWYAIARKNAEHYGFDKRMLEELYRIAGDNNW